MKTLPRNIVVSAILISFAIVLQACAGFRGLPIPASLVDPEAHPAKEEVLATERSTANPMVAYESQVYDLLIAKDFAGLEKEAATARSSRERFRGGFWKLDSLYNASITFYAEYEGQRVTAEMWKNRIELLKMWKAEIPRSITARVALADAYINYGWFIRGSGYINTVSRSDHAAMKEQLKLGKAELSLASEFGTCPRLDAALLMLMKVDGVDPAEFDELFEKAIKREPNYIQHYKEKADYLKPKWRGSEDAWQAFVDSIPGKVATLKTDEGDIIYFIVVAGKLGDRTFSNNWAMIARERIKRGFEDSEKKFGPSKYRLNQFAYLSVVSGDLESAKKAFERIGDERNDAVWGPDTFLVMKTVAERGSYK